MRFTLRITFFSFSYISLLLPRFPSSQCILLATLHYIAFFTFLLYLISVIVIVILASKKSGKQKLTELVSAESVDL
jgi:hypothetical protein